MLDAGVQRRHLGDLALGREDIGITRTALEQQIGSVVGTCPKRTISEMASCMTQPGMGCGALLRSGGREILKKRTMSWPPKLHKPACVAATLYI